MSQPPYPPPGGSEPEGEQPGSQAWPPPQENADQPTEQFGTPGEPQREQTQQFAQPPYGQPPGPAPSGQPQYGQQPGQEYGQPPYGPPGAPWGAPGGPAGQQPKGSKNTLIALIIAGVVVLAAIGVALFLVLGKNDTPTASSATTAATSKASSGSSERTKSSGSSSSSPADSSTPGGANAIPPAGAPPEGLGADPVLDQYAQSCYDGNMDACDTLYNDSEVGSAYETYGGTCAGRQPASNSDVVYCADAFPG